MSTSDFSEVNNVTTKLHEVEARAVPIGTFADTLSCLVVLHNGEDTGDQGGGQN